MHTLTFSSSLLCGGTMVSIALAIWHTLRKRRLRIPQGLHPEMMLHVELRQPGTYSLWLQFRGGKQLWVAPFVITAP